jgi:hypothetical protein
MGCVESTTIKNTEVSIVQFCSRTKKYLIDLSEDRLIEAPLRLAYRDEYLEENEGIVVFTQQNDIKSSVRSENLAHSKEISAHAISKIANREKKKSSHGNELQLPAIK